jgi:hypothetical protein
MNVVFVREFPRIAWMLVTLGDGAVHVGSIVFVRAGAIRHRQSPS